MIFDDTLDLGQIYCIERRALVGAGHYDLVTPLRVRRIHRTAARSFRRFRQNYPLSGHAMQVDVVCEMCKCRFQHGFSRSPDFGKWGSSSLGSNAAL
jgi:hypothetical protein